MRQEKMIKFTFALPVHNGEPYIREAMDSLLAQSYPHFEIVVLENGSTDNTIEIIQSYADSRIRMISSDTLLSIEENWARILDIEEPNEYLVLMCADDILYPDFLSEIAKLIIAEPDATLYHSHGEFIDTENQLIRLAKKANYIESADEYITALHTFSEDAFGTGYVMRYADFQRVEGFPKFRRLLFADFYCYYSLTKLGYKVCVQSQLVSFRRNTKGVTSESVLDDFIIASQQYREVLVQDPNFNSEVLLDDFLQRFLLSQYRRYLFNLIKNKQNLNIESFQENKLRFLSEQYPNKVFDYDYPINWYVYLAENPIWVVRIIIFYGTLVGIYIRKRILSLQIAKNFLGRLFL